MTHPALPAVVDRATFQAELDRLRRPSLLPAWRHVYAGQLMARSGQFGGKYAWTRGWLAEISAVLRPRVASEACCTSV